MEIAATVEAFFDHYRSHDVEGMLSQFSPSGTIDYLPAKLSGPATVAGKQIWEALIETFPDLTNEVTATYPSADGRFVVAEVMISGTQAKDGFGIANQGKAYRLPHVFIVKGNEDGRIASMRAYWDNAEWYRQLGKVALDG